VADADNGQITEVLDRLGIRLGEPVRFRKTDGARWLSGKMSSVAVDGSITIHDANGAARSLRPERIEVRRPGARGKLTWQLLSDVAVTWEQLELW
jgi:hypothetical protein